MKTLWINIKLFLDGALLSYLALFAWLRPTTFIASMIVMPLGQIIFFTVLGIYATGAQNASFYLIGNSMQLTCMAVYWLKSPSRLIEAVESFQAKVEIRASCLNASFRSISAACTSA